MKRTYSKALVCLAIILVVAMSAITLCGCFASSINDSGKVTNRLVRRGYDVVEYTGGFGDGFFQLSMSGLEFSATDSTEFRNPFGIRINNAIIAINEQTCIIISRGITTTKETRIYFVYCESEADAILVCYKINSSKESYEIVEHQGAVAYYGDKYAYKAASRDVMIWFEISGTHID